MSYYNIIGYLFQGLTVLIPVYLIIKGGDIKFNSVICLLCYACIFSSDFRILGAVSLVHILLCIISFSNNANYDRPHQKSSELKNIIIFYMIYVSVITILGYLIKSDYILKGSIVQNQLRPLVQILFMVFAYFAVISSSSICESKSHKVILFLYKTLLFLAVIAIIQSLIYKVCGFDILPMRKDFVSESEGLSAVADNGFLRATAGVGEPKHLAKFLSIGFSFQLLCHKFLGYKKIKIFHILVFLVAIFFTSSTTGYLICMIGFIFWLLKQSKKNFTFIIVAIVLCVLIVPFVLKLPVITDKFDTAGVNDEIIGLENSDTAAVRWLLNEPIYSIFGVGLSNTVAYANEYAPSASQYINSYPYTLRRGVIYHIAETGIIGLIIELIIFKKLYIKCRKNSDTKFMFLFICIMYLFLTMEAISQFQLLLLTMLSNCSETIEEKELKN